MKQSPTIKIKVEVKKILDVWKAILGSSSYSKTISLLCDFQKAVGSDSKKGVSDE